MSRELTAAEVEQRRSASVTHGAESPARIVRVARTQKRRWMSRSGMRARDLDGVSGALLDNWSRAQAKVELLDQYFAAVGLLDDGGEPRAATRIYFTALNSARLAAVRLAEHLKTQGNVGPDPLALLEAAGRRVIEQRATNGDGS